MTAEVKSRGGGCGADGGADGDVDGGGGGGGADGDGDDDNIDGDNNYDDNDDDNECGGLKSLAAFVSSSWALHCYECGSEESFEHCDSVREEKECGADETMCGSASVSAEWGTYYGRGCLSEEVYENLHSTCAEHGAACEIEVCESDFCNGGGDNGSGLEGFRDFLKRKRNL